VGTRFHSYMNLLERREEIRVGEKSKNGILGFQKDQGKKFVYQPPSKEGMLH